MTTEAKKKKGERRTGKPSWYTRQWFTATVTVLSRLIIILASLSMTRIILYSCTTQL